MDNVLEISQNLNEQKKELEKLEKALNVSSKQSDEDYEKRQSRFTEGIPVPVDISKIKLVNKPK